MPAKMLFELSLVIMVLGRHSALWVTLFNQHSVINLWKECQTALTFPTHPAEWRLATMLFV